MIVAGLGFRSNVPLAALREVFLAAGGASADALATVAEKAQASVLRDLAAERNLPILAIAAQDLAAQTTLSHSPRVQARFGTGSLAEAAALAAAGPDARLIAPRSTSADGMATAALAIRTIP